MDGLSAYLPKSFGTQRPKKEQQKTQPQKKDDLLSNFLPTSFGQKRKQPTKKSFPSPKKQKTNDEEHSYENPSDDSFQAPQLPKKTENTKSTETFNIVHKPKKEHPLPISDCIELKAHKGAILSTAIDPSGSRLLTGSSDFNIHFWDFAGMMSNYRR